jgi:hypothetical protein
MKRLCTAAVVLLAACPSSRGAEVVVQAPFVSVRAGRGEATVFVRIPCLGELRIQKRVANGAPVIPVEALPAPIPALPPLPAVPPAQPAPPLPPPPAAVPARPPTLAEFAAAFQPAPGTYEVVLTHPVTGTPVTVAFTLPAGSPRKVHVRRRELEFDYGRHFVRLHFDRHGVRVQSR